LGFNAVSEKVWHLLTSAHKAKTHRIIKFIIIILTAVKILNIKVGLREM
jgi:hypothetical protein